MTVPLHCGVAPVGGNLSHDSPRTPNVHIRASNTTKIQRKEPPEREEKNEFCGGRGKKRAKKGGPGEGRSPEGRSREGRSRGHRTRPHQNLETNTHT